MLSSEELKNITVLCEIGAKAMSADKPLIESAQIQGIAVALIAKLKSENELSVPVEAVL